MTTQGENALLAKIADDVVEIKVGVAEIRTSLETNIKVTDDHEDRIRVVEQQFVSKAGLWRVAGLCAAVSATFSTVLIALIHHA